MKIVTSYRSDLLGISAAAEYFTDETAHSTTPSDATFTVTKMPGELVEFRFKHRRETSSSFSWSLIREAIARAKLDPQFMHICATLSYPAISLD